MVLLSKAFTGVPPLQLIEQPHFMRLHATAVECSVGGNVTPLGAVRLRFRA
jgi:hypothetical protein